MPHPDPTYVPDFQLEPPHVKEHLKTYQVGVSCLCGTGHIVEAYSIKEAEELAIEITKEEIEKSGLIATFSDFESDYCDCIKGDEDDEPGDNE